MMAAPEAPYMVQDPFEIVGTTIHDKYRVEHTVDEKRFNIVYRAEHVIWNQPVALKCFKLLADVAEDQRDKLLRAFVQEGQLLAALSSRTAAIVQARDIGTFVTAGGQWVPYMVMEWLEGRSLDHALYNEKLKRMPARTVRELLKLMEPAANALEVAHSMNIAHRDLKPGNFFVIGDPRAPDAFADTLQTLAGECADRYRAALEARMRWLQPVLTVFVGALVLSQLVGIFAMLEIVRRQVPTW